MRETIEQGIADQPVPEQAPALSPEIQEHDDFAASLEQLPSQVREVIGEEEQRLLRSLFEKDKATFEHSLDVARIVDRQWPEFSAELEKEGVTYADMARASTLHDIGKLDLPDCILKGSMDDHRFAQLLDQFIAEQPDAATELLQRKGLIGDGRTAGELSAEERAHLDHRDAVPLEFCFRGQPAAMAEIIHSGLDPQMTFMDALRTHEGKSEAYIGRLAAPGHEVAAGIAGSHHNYRQAEQLQYPYGSRLLEVSDAFEAMTHKRNYQEPMDETAAFERITALAKQGVFRPDIAERWIANYRGSAARAA